MPISSSTNLDEYFDLLRLWLGDINSSSYRYTDVWLRTALTAGVEALAPWWNRKYLINQTTNDIERNNTYWTYRYSSPPIVQQEDVQPIILMASIIIKSGSLENFSWSLGRWRDAEISYSNIASGQTKDASLKRDLEFLGVYLTSPTKKLRNSLKGSLPGYMKNVHESKQDY
jgi:hypothetical protein